jgi:hypothetical protein
MRRESACTSRRPGASPRPSSLLVLAGRRLPGTRSARGAQRTFRRLIYRRWAASGHEWRDQEFQALTDHLNEPARARASTFSYRAAIKEFVTTAAGRCRRVTATTPTLLLLGGADGCIDPVLAHRERSKRR